MAHEINTPLGIVRTAASFDPQSDWRPGTTEDLVEASALIERNIERAHRLVEEFKTLSVSQVSDALEQLDLVRVVEEMVELFSINARRSGLRVRWTIGSRPRMRRDVAGYRGPSQPGGAEFADQRRALRVPAGCRRRGVESKSGRMSSDGFVLGVRDHGRGIAPEADLPRVFDPFFTTGRAQGGTGLGLAIVRNLVRDGLGGSVEITSEPGAGTRVTIHLPAAAPPPAS